MTKNDGSIKKGHIAKAITVPALEIAQGEIFIYYFSMPASQVWKSFAISRKQEDDPSTYQRILSASRVGAVAKYIAEGNAIPGPVIVSLEKATFGDGELTIPAGSNRGWILDGQHRLAGAHEAAEQGYEIEIGVAAFVGLSEAEEINQFITINTEAKSVPKSLLLDLLKVVPPKNAKELAEARAVDVIDALRKDSASVFYNRIVVVNAPSKGQISLTNFVRKILPLVHPDRGRLRHYTLQTQAGIFENYFAAFSQVFPSEWNKVDSVFFKTVGFGAVMNCFDEIFEITYSKAKAFRVKDIITTLEPVSDFQFEKFGEYGSGNKAEMAAAADFMAELKQAKSGGSSEDGKLDIPL